MKKIKILAIIILMITAVIILRTKVEATTGTVNSDTVRVRKEPSTSSTILTQLDQNDEVEILELSEGWYQVQFEEDGETITGYISETLLDVEEEPQENETETPPTETTEEPVVEPTEQPEDQVPPENTDIPVEVPTIDIEVQKEYTLQQEVAIRILPLITSREKAQISGNIKTIEIMNDWCKIENDTEVGWVRINQLKKSIIVTETPTDSGETGEQNPQTSEETDTTDVDAPIIKTAYVSTASLKVRAEATTESEVIDSLMLNNEVYIIEELDGWYKIKIGEQIGYVSSQYISDTKTEETTSRGSSGRGDSVTPIESTETTETTEEPVSSTTGTTGEEVVAYAKQFLGYKYVAGGASPSGFDCSGFTSYVYKHFGISINRTSKDQIKNGVAVDRSNLQLGDLVVFNGESNKTIGHVGIYVGGGSFIHASNPKGGVKIDSLSSSYYNPRYVGARRLI